MYPERRPYATAVEHSGYLSKPVLPPVEALRILNSAVGMDLPRSLRQGSFKGSSQPFTPSKKLPPQGLQLRKPPTLESASPFAFNEKDYHNSQQVALNAQLSETLETYFKAWHSKVHDLLQYLKGYPPQCATSNTLTVDALDKYLEGYRCTDVQPMEPAQLVKDFKLQTNLEILDAIQGTPAIQADSIRRTLDALLNSTYFLAPLNQYVQELEPLAELALPDESQEVVNGMIQGPVWLSKAAVALHEKFFYDPSEYALMEIRKSDHPIERLERRVLEAKNQKERCLEEELPGEALRFLTSQVDFNNDLLLMNKARLELVQLLMNDVRELKPLVDSVVGDARCSVQLLKGRVDRDVPLVQKDLENLQQDVQNTTEHIDKLMQEDSKANLASHTAIRDMEGAEKELWAILLQTMQRLVDASHARDAFAKSQMRLREQRAHDMAVAKELLKAQKQYVDRLRCCEEILWRWSNAAEMYNAYVEAYVPRLLKKVHEAEEAAEDLYNQEAQNYVRRYEMFEYAVEEGRATRTVHIDRLKAVLRSRQLDVERVSATLDPHVEKYKREMTETQIQLDDASAYIDLLHALERERRDEVEPVLQHVISFNRTMQTQMAEIEAASRLLELCDKEVLDSLGGEDTISTKDTGSSAIETVVHGADSEPIVEATDVMGAISHVVSPSATNVLKTYKTIDSNPMMATVAHPHIQARNVGLDHEEAFLEKWRRFTDNEQKAQEGAAGRLRQSRQDIEKLGMKYNNSDYVRMLANSSEGTVPPRGTAA